MAWIVEGISVYLPMTAIRSVRRIRCRDGATIEMEAALADINGLPTDLELSGLVVRLYI